MSCLHHPIPAIRQQVERDVALTDVPPQMIVSQCPTDMLDDRKQSYAIETLSKQQIPESERAWVAGELFPVVQNFRALTRRDEFLDLSENLGERGHPLLVAGLGSPVLRVRERIQKIGSVMEGDVIAVLDSELPITQRNAIEVLGAIGTERSLAPLRALAERSPGLRSAATQAIRQIESRFGQTPGAVSPDRR